MLYSFFFNLKFNQLLTDSTADLLQKAIISEPRAHMAGSASANEVRIPPAEADIVNAETRKEGIFAGLTCGLASAVIGQHLFGLKGNKTLFCGVLSGILSGVLFTQAFRDTAMRKLREEHARKGAESIPEKALG